MTKILVIEDDCQVRDNIIDILELENFETLRAENGNLGIKKAQENIPDLIICDIMMPEMDGYGVLKEIRNNPKTNLIPFIFLTAKADKYDFRQGMELGADDYLTKPFTPTELIKAIDARLKKQSLYNINNIEDIINAKHEHYYHKITNFPNGLFLEKKIAELSSEKIALMLINLDQFGWIVSNFGNEFKIKLMKKFSERLKECQNNFSTYINFTAHLEDAKFALILANFANQNELELTIKPLLKILSKPLQIENKEILISLSLGVAIHEKETESKQELINNASISMYISKSKGGNHPVYYTSEMKNEAAIKLNIASNLRYALEKKEFQLYYQPQIDIKTKKIIGAEALLRWENQELGFISPVQFIPIAEETGLIIKIGEWVLKTACKQVKIWQEKYSYDLQIAVNLSPRQLKQNLLKETIINIIKETGIKPNLLDLELTESLLMDDVNLGIKILQDLKSIGVKISIDDFGTGYSSLSYLQKFPFDILKIDRCFIQKINQNNGNHAITKAIIAMAQDLHLKVIAEGVETEEELQILTQNNCDAFQGYLFSPPVPAAKFENLLLNHETDSRNSK